MYDAVHGGMPRAIIETFVRHKLIELKTDPERCARGLVDMALDFSEGRFQKYFFCLAQDMLKNRQSSYYSVIGELAVNVDTEKLLTFGMNLGYNSLTFGAKKIRGLEAVCGYNIPWTVMLEISSERLPELDKSFCSLFAQGRELGIYTWFIRAIGRPHRILEYVEQNPEYAFILITNAEEIDEEFVDAAEKCRNLMLSVNRADEALCDLLKKRKMLYSVFCDVKSVGLNEAESLISQDMYDRYGTPFLLLLGSAPETGSGCYGKICEQREGHQSKTVPFDIYNDLQYIDSVISDDSCLSVFDVNGNLLRGDGKPDTRYNFHEKKLCDILSECFRK